MTSNKTTFHFARKAIDWPHCITFCRRQPPATQPEQRASDPLIGYLNYYDITECRRKILQHRRYRRRGDLSGKKLSLITPQDWTTDPYLVCVLLSLAQLQQRLVNQPQETEYTSRPLVTDASDTEFIYLYEAQISSRILKFLDSPTTTSSICWPTIQREKIPFKPFESFKHRLESALLEPGDLQKDGSLPVNVDGNTVESLKRRDAEDDHQHSQKRKLRTDEKD